MKRIIVPLVGVLAGTLSGALVVFLQHRRLRERVSYWPVNATEKIRRTIELKMVTTVTNPGYHPQPSRS